MSHVLHSSMAHSGTVLLGAYYSYERGDRTSTISRVIAERLSFHSIASVILPGIVIHQSLHSFEHDLNRRVALAKRNSSISRKLWVPSPIALRWGPTAIALTLIPFLPLAFDEPVEWATAKAFDVMWPVHRERSAE
ncbi:hypothetical protein BJ742DRAFT_336886 [Cladochytrium replicatum]|nr:hypothetical protein BJ742DRAFT_336886 [Cladochytrium replicatum]